MPAPKKDPLEVKIPFPIGIRKKVTIAFDKRMGELSLNRSNTVESLMEQFLNDTK